MSRVRGLTTYGVPPVIEAAITVALFVPPDWVALTSAFIWILSSVDRDAVLAHGCINRDLRAGRLRAALVAPDGTILKLLEASDWQQRTVRAPLNPAEGVRVEPPFEEGRVFLWKADLTRWYSPNPATLAAPADRQLHAAGGSEPSQSPQAEQQPQQQQPPAAPAPVTSATLPPAEGSPPLAREAAVAPTSDAKVEPEGLPSATQQSVAKPAPERAEATRWQRERAKAAMKTLYPPHGIHPEGVSIQAVTNRINRLEDFQEDKVSHDTVRLADIEIKTALEK
jgi:hypothetical protein